MDIPPELQEVLKRGECVLFVGAGVSEGLPQWKDLMKPLARELEINPGLDPPSIAEYYENKFGRPQLENKIYSQLKKEVPLTEVHKIITQLRFKAIITTNFDHQLEKALKNKDYYKIVDGRKAPTMKENQLPLIKMHGDMKEPGTMILTQTDYEDYPETHRAMITFLLRYFISNNFLFIGYSLTDPDFNNIFAQIRSLFGENQRKSFIIIKKPSKDKTGQFEHEINRLKKKNIESVPIDDYDQIPHIFQEFMKICSQTITISYEITQAQFESIKQTYLEVVGRQNRWLDPRGIFQFERMLTCRDVELEEIYVPPRLLRRKLVRKKGDPSKKDDAHEKQFLDDKKFHNEEKSSIEPIWEPLIGEKGPEYVSEVELELQVNDLLSDAQQNHHVILGSPGVGKSCLLRYIALRVSQDHASLGLKEPLLPVLIPLRECDRFGKGEMLKDFIFHYIKSQICSLPDEILSTLFEKNSFLFLFDGLDEILNESDRVELSRQIEQFMGQYKDTKIIITSRPAGYQPASLIGSIPHYTLSEFNEEEIRELLRKWFIFLDKIEEERFDIANTERKSDTLADIIIKEKKGRIVKLARNPLLLTILILIERVGKKIPERRVEFYECAVKTISGSWEKWKNLEIHKDRDIPDQVIILHILEKIGFYLHSQKQENVVHITELKQWIQEAMEEEMGTYSRKQINDFIWMLRERSGLLVERGIDLYGFVHLTFQEYFAACYIATGRGISKVQELIHEYLYSSRWREVFFLAISIANPREADIILDATLEAHNPFEKYIHSNLIIAGSMLTDLPRVKIEKRENVVSDLISLTSSKNLDLLRINIIEKMAEIGKFYKIKNKWAFELLGDPDEDVRYQTIQYFTTVGSDDEYVRERIFELMKDSDIRVQYQTIQYFTTVGNDDESMRERFFEFLKDPDKRVQHQAIQYFTILGSDDESVKARIFELLSIIDEDVHYQTIQYFTSMGSDEEFLKARIFELLKDPDWRVRSQAIQYFTTIGSDDEYVRERFFGLLKDPDKIVQYQTIQYFTTIGSDDESVKARIFELLKDSDKTVQYQAIQYFTTVGSDEEFLKARIFELLKDSDEDIRSQAIQYFTTIGSDDEYVRERFFKMLKNPNILGQDRAIQYFTFQGNDDESVKARIFELLKDPDWRVRSQAIQYFTTVGSDEEYVRERISALIKNSNKNVRSQAIQYFTTIGSDDEFLKVIISTLLKDPDWRVRSQAIQYFITIGSNDEDVRKKIFELLKDETHIIWLDKSIQEIAVDYLSKHAKQESFEKAPILFQSNNKSIKRGAYKLMKSLLGVEY